MKRVATSISEYRPNSHADVIGGRILGGCFYDGAHHDSSLDVVSTAYSPREETGS